MNNYYQPNTGFSMFPPGVKNLLAINILVFIAMLSPALRMIVIKIGALWPIGSGLFQPWQMITYSFLHASFGHIFFNLFALFMFGQTLERVWGTKKFLIYYFITAVGGGLLHMVISGISGPIVPTLGASGAVFGLLLGFGMLFPNQPIFLMFLPIPIKAKYFVAIYGLLELFSGITMTNSNIAHFAHLGGMLFGFIVIKVWKLDRIY